MNSENTNYRCYKCNRQVTLSTNQKVSFRDSCLNCKSDLHSCKNCHFHDPKLNNECSENQAEKVLDREKNNRCEYFRFRVENNSSAGGIDKLKDLFK